MKSSSLVPPSLAKQSAKRFAEQGISKRSNHTRTHIKNSTKQWVQFPRPSLPRKELQYHHHPQQIIQPKETAWTRPFNSTSAFVTRLYPVCLQKSSNHYSPMVIERTLLGKMDPTMHLQNPPHQQADLKSKMAELSALRTSRILKPIGVHLPSTYLARSSKMDCIAHTPKHPAPSIGFNFHN